MRFTQTFRRGQIILARRREPLSVRSSRFPRDSRPCFPSSSLRLFVRHASTISQKRIGISSWGGGRNGFTLLETIIALSLILAAVVGPVAVVTRSISSFPSAKNRLAALHLAQEGIEIVRLVRENNVLCDQLNGKPKWDWERHPSGSGSMDGTWEVDATQIGPEGITCGGNPVIPMPLFSPAQAGVGNQNLSRDPATGLVGYGGAEPTIFRRTVTVRSPPDNEDQANNINKNDQMDVISRVWWDERGVRKEVELRERLYNWR